MRRKITPRELVEAGADLPELTSNQQKFVEGLLAGKNASDAYRAAYDCSNYTTSSVWCNASKLNSDARVVQWLAMARKAHLGSSKWSLDRYLLALEESMQECKEAGNHGAAVQALQLIGKAVGHYTEQVSLKVDDPIDSLKEIAKISPELATILAREQKLDQWQPEPTQH